MRKSNKMLAAGLVIMMLVLQGCGGSAPQTAETTAAPASAATEAAAAEAVVDTGNYQETITFAPRLDFATMDVQNTPSVVTKSVYYLIYNTLVENDPVKGELIPALAESWNQVSGTEIEFKLREGVKFHDGSDFTAEDVKFTYEKALESDGSKSKLASLDSVEIVDDYNLKIHLKEDNMDFLYTITDPSLSILSEKAFESLGEEKGIQQGTGPYKYAEWAQGDYLDLEANADYWGGAPKTAKIKIRNIPEAASRVIAVQTGEIDVLQEPPASEIPNIQSNQDLQLVPYPGATVNFIGMNVNEAPMDNQTLRKAIAYALNREEIAIGTYQGTATPLNNIMHSSNEFYSEINATENNLDEARKLLAEAGYKEGELTLTLACNQAATTIAACTIIQAELQQIGINVEINQMENATLSASMSEGKGYHLCYSRWSGYAFGPDYALRQMLYTGGSNNYAHLSDEKMDQMLDAALKISDKEERKAAYKEIEQYSDDLMAVYPILIEDYAFVAKKNVQGIDMPNGPIMNFRNVYLPQ